jgi:hypothetical protein
MKSLGTRIETIEPEINCRPPSNVGAIRALSSAESVNDQLAAVQEAYQETVMAVDHYGEDYGEPFEQHVYYEFGPDMFEALTHNSSLSPLMYRRLRTNITDAIESRKQVLGLLATERGGLWGVRTALVFARERIEAIESCPFREWTTAALHEEYDQVQALRGRCEHLAAERQSTRKEYIEPWSTLPD